MSNVSGEWRALTHGSTVRAVLGEMLPEAAVLADVERKQFDERGRSTVALPSPLGDRLAVLHPSAQHISVLDGSSLEHLGAIQGAGHMITAMVFDEAGDTLFTWVWLDRSRCLRRQHSRSHHQTMERRSKPR